MTMEKTPAKTDAAFQAVVLAWLQAQHPDAAAAAVDGIEPSGTDWAGDTEGGFHADFEVTIRYTRADGRAVRLPVRGEDMESLWTYVMRSWPA